jgi:hypothetical protein
LALNAGFSHHFFVVECAAKPVSVAVIALRCESRASCPAPGPRAHSQQRTVALHFPVQTHRIFASGVGRQCLAPMWERAGGRTLAFVLIVCATVAGWCHAAADRELRVGVVLPLTGPLAPLYQDVARGGCSRSLLLLLSGRGPCLSQSCAFFFCLWFCPRQHESHPHPNPPPHHPPLSLPVSLAALLVWEQQANAMNHLHGFNVTDASGTCGGLCQ